MVLVATQVKRRRGTTAENDAFTGAEGEITVDLTKKTLRVHDGSTQGGTELAKTEDLTEKTNTDLSNITSTGKEVCANMAMPSNRYTDMTLGASGAEYTAPADGYVQLNVNINTNHGYALIQDMSNGLSVFYRHWSTSNMETRLFMPIKKNGVYIVGHNGVVQVNMFRFIYAQGAQ